LDDVGLLAYYSYECKDMHGVGLKLSTMRDIDLHIQTDIPSWKELIVGDDQRLTKAVSRVLDQRRDGHLILPWTQYRHLLSSAIGLISIAELVQATEAYYSTVEGFITGDPLLLRRVAGHIARERDMYSHIAGERDMYVFRGGHDLDWENVKACGDSLMNGHWEELIVKVEELLHATHDPDNYRMHIRHIIQFSSDDLQRLESFLRLHVKKCVQGVIECEWLCIGPCRPPTTTDGQGKVDMDGSFNC